MILCFVRNDEIKLFNQIIFMNWYRGINTKTVIQGMMIHSRESVDFLLWESLYL